MHAETTKPCLQALLSHHAGAKTHTGQLQQPYAAVHSHLQHAAVGAGEASWQPILHFNYLAIDVEVASEQVPEWAVVVSPACTTQPQEAAVGREA
jgi:hypothetical protein